MFPDRPFWQPLPQPAFDPGMAAGAADVVKGVGSLLDGIRANRAAKSEARLIDAETAQRTEAANRRGARAKGALRARLAARGLDPDAATAGLLQAETAEDTALERETIARRGFNRAEATRHQGKAALVGGVFDFAGSLVGSGMDLGGQQGSGQATAPQGRSAAGRSPSALSGPPSFRGLKRPPL